MKAIFRIFLMASALVLGGQTMAADWAAGSTEWQKLPEAKRTQSALYLTPKQAYEMKTGAAQTVAFFDVRTRAEAMYVGHPTVMDALVPYVEHQEVMLDWDEKRSMYKLEPNNNFESEIGRRLKAMGLGKDAAIILICRSGDRSSKAADFLAKAGYTKVYSVAEGFEGDTASAGDKKGQRVVNGWKNAGLPWTYKLDKAKAYFPR
ncbi:rhodanese-like domain-containing protein [beta proteobacterium MWH-UniP1]